MKFSGYSPKAKQMNEKRSIMQRFHLLRYHALRRGEEWNIELDDFTKWSEDNSVLDRKQVAPSVCRKDAELPWDINNLLVTHRRISFNALDDAVTLTVGQWVDELKNDQKNKMA